MELFSSYLSKLYRIFFTTFHLTPQSVWAHLWVCYCREVKGAINSRMP